MLSLAAASALEPIGMMVLRVEGLPEGAYIRTEGKKENSDEKQVYWTRDTVGLNNVARHEGDQVYYTNANGEDFGQTFELCIPKEKGSVDLDITLTLRANTHYYGTFLAKPDSGRGSKQNMIVANPPMKDVESTCRLTASSIIEEPTKLRIVKKDANTAEKLAGAEFKINIWQME